jgi:hypothetical protein
MRPALVVEAAAVSLTTASGATWPVELVRTRLEAALDARAYEDNCDARADVGASRARAYMTEGRVVQWSRCEWGR